MENKIKNDLEPKKLNLGCDFDYKEGWINLDFHTNLKADVIHDLNNFPWPFKDNTFKFILANHVIEHLREIPKVMNELWRISKPGAIIKIVVPYFNNFNSFRDVTHINFFTWDTFSPFTGTTSAREKRKVGYLEDLFKYKSRKLIWGVTEKKILKPICLFMNWLVNVNPDFVERRIPFLITTEALEVKLIVKK
jgi:SAM-dependent methyltransferase